MSTPPSHVDQVIVLSCFGRGGSSIVWRMIGSSPDVLMPEDEWHVAVFRRNDRLRKGLRSLFRRTGIRSLQPLRALATRRVLENLRSEDLRQKPQARACVVKVMDHHLVFDDLIYRSFPKASGIVLVRHPYGLCESLMRSGLPLEAACRWYRDVAELMVVEASRPESAIIRFEDVVCRPMEVCRGLYSHLGIRWADDGRFEFKIKPYGSSRTANVDVARGEFVRVGASEVDALLDQSVLDGETLRLSDEQRRQIWTVTGGLASRFGYTAMGCKVLEAPAIPIGTGDFLLH